MTLSGKEPGLRSSSKMQVVHNVRNVTVLGRTSRSRCSGKRWCAPARHVVDLPCASSSNGLTEEEENYYQEALEEQRRRKEDILKETRRREQFSPLTDNPVAPANDEALSKEPTMEELQQAFAGVHIPEVQVLPSQGGSKRPVRRGSTDPPKPLLTRNRNFLSELEAEILKDAEEEEEEDDDDLDWDALAQFEQFQNYQDDLAVQERKKMRQLATTSSPSPPPGRRGAQLAEPDERTELDRELDEWEDLVKFFELVEGGEVAGKPEDSGAQRPGRRKRPNPDDVGQGVEPKADLAALEAEGIHWDKIERVLLGKGWEERLLADVGKLPNEADGPPGAAVGEEEGEVSGENLWGDEVTNLLLGLVGISYQKYLNKPLLDTKVTEDERARAYWHAPFALLVQDDSPEARIDYVNEAGVKLLGQEYIDLFGTSIFNIVDPEDVSAQEDWIFAMKEVDEGFNKYVVLPRVPLITASGGRVVARDVVMFCVESLEEDSIGHGVLIRDWEDVGARRRSMGPKPE